MVWPETFATNTIPDNYNEAALCADALQAWSLCMAGETRPETFGETMSKIGSLLGVSPTPEGITEASKRFLPD